MTPSTPTNSRGFTLLEVLLYISLAAIALVAVSILFSLVVETKLKQEAIAAVNEQGNMVLTVVTQTIRNASTVNNLPPGSIDTTNLSLTTPFAQTDPTVFSLINGTLVSTLGSGEAIPLTSTQVAMSDLQFQNYGQPATTGTIRIQFTLTTVNALYGYRYNFQKTFYGSATIR